MTIPLMTISKGAERGLSVTEIVYLLTLQDGALYLINNHKSYFNECYISLIDKGYIKQKEEGFILTNSGAKLLSEIEGNENVSNKVDNNYLNLHKKLQEELKVLVGKPQKVIGGKYSWLCNAKDLEIKLSKIIKKYQIKDFEKVEKVLLNYLYQCYKANWEYCTLLEYYIEKGGHSRFVTDYEGFSEEMCLKRDKTDNKTVFDI